MRNNTKDETLKKNYLQKYQFLIAEYEAVKAKSHPTYKKAKDFYAAHNTCPQTFLKYYGRYKSSGKDLASFIPGKRGPRFKTRRASAEIEQMVLELREKGCNKFEINDILQPKLQCRTPSPSGVYTILRRHGRNRLTKPMIEEKRRIIKEKAGELAHIDCHHLSKDTIMNDNKGYYLVCVIDAHTRIAWAEVMSDIKALTVMFATLHCFNYIARYFDVRFAEVLTDNGPEFGSRQSNNKEQHPFERLLLEMGIKHRYTKPYCPQTNGKVECFWRTLNEDLIDGTHFESIECFKKELEEYLAYYNKLRPHQALDGKTPYMRVQNCQRIM